MMYGEYWPLTEYTKLVIGNDGSDFQNFILLWM
jgi:hypothetical protein